MYIGDNSKNLLELFLLQDILTIANHTLFKHLHKNKYQLQTQFDHPTYETRSPNKIIVSGQIFKSSLLKIDMENTSDPILHNFKVLPGNQSSIRPLHGCTTALLAITDDIIYTDICIEFMRIGNILL